MNKNIVYEIRNSYSNFQDKCEIVISNPVKDNPFYFY